MRETESTVVAAVSQTLSVNYFKKGKLWKKKFKVNAGYVQNMKRLLTT